MERLTREVFVKADEGWKRLQKGRKAEELKEIKIIAMGCS